MTPLERLTPPSPKHFTPHFTGPLCLAAAFMRQNDDKHHVIGDRFPKAATGYGIDCLPVLFPLGLGIPFLSVSRRGTREAGEGTRGSA